MSSLRAETHLKVGLEWVAKLDRLHQATPSIRRAATQIELMRNHSRHVFTSTDDEMHKAKWQIRTWIWCH